MDFLLVHKTASTSGRAIRAMEQVRRKVSKKEIFPMIHGGLHV